MNKVLWEPSQTSQAPEQPEPQPQPEERQPTPEPEPAPEVSAQPAEDEWRDRALRLQADMDNFRKRQQRLSQERVEANRQRMLRDFLDVVDDLERALEAPDSSVEGLREGVELTHRSALQLLKKEGVEQIQAESQPFDPNWHDAVATVAHNGNEQVANTNVHVTEPGYRLGDQLLRPAKVIVAV